VASSSSSGTTSCSSRSVSDGGSEASRLFPCEFCAAPQLPVSTNLPRTKGERWDGRRARVRGTCLERGSRGWDAELGTPLTEHLVDLLLEDGGVGGAALLASGLEAAEHLL